MSVYYKFRQVVSFILLLCIQPQPTTKIAYSLARNFGLHIVRIRCSMMPEVRKIKVLTQWCNISRDPIGRIVC